MKASRRRIVAGLSLMLGLGVALGLRLAEERARDARRHDVWMDYVRGPLTFYVQGSQEGARALLARPGRMRRRELVDAAQDRGQALGQAADLQAGIDADADLEGLDAAMPWLTSTQQLSQGWAVLLARRPDQIGPALASAEALRLHLASVSHQVWRQVSEDTKFTPAQFREIATVLAELGKPLPEKPFKTRDRYRLRERRLDR